MDLGYKSEFDVGSYVDSFVKLHTSAGVMAGFLKAVNEGNDCLLDGVPQVCRDERGDYVCFTDGVLVHYPSIILVTPTDEVTVRGDVHRVEFDRKLLDSWVRVKVNGGVKTGLVDYISEGELAFSSYVDHRDSPGGPELYVREGGRQILSGPRSMLEIISFEEVNRVVGDHNRCLDDKDD